MSRRIVGYDGEGRRRRPIYSDEGPAAAGAVSGLAAIGRLSALQIKETAGDIEFGAGQVERRQITADEDAARRELEDRPSPIALVRPAMGSPEHLQQSRMRGAVRHQEVMAERVLAVVSGPMTSARTLEEESAVEAAATVPEPTAEVPDEQPPETLGDTLAILLDATSAAETAWRRHEEVRAKHEDLTAVLAGAEAEWISARAALEASWTSTWMGFRSPLPDDVLPPLEELARVAEQRHEQLLNGDEPRPSTAHPQPDEAPAAVVPDREASVFAQIVRTGSVMAAAIAMGLSDARIRQYVKRAKDEGRLPPEVAACIRSRS